MALAYHDPDYRIASAYESEHAAQHLSNPRVCTSPTHQLCGFMSYWVVTQVKD